MFSPYSNIAHNFREYSTVLLFLLSIFAQQESLAQERYTDSLPENAALSVNLIGPLSIYQPFLELRYRPACQWQKYRLDGSISLRTSYRIQYRNYKTELTGETKNPYAIGGTIGLNRLIGRNGWCVRLEGMYRFIHSDNKNWLRHSDYNTDRLHAYSRRVHQVGLLAGVEWLYVDRSPVQRGRLSLKCTIGWVRVIDKGQGLLPNHKYTYERFEGRSIFFYDSSYGDKRFDLLATFAVYYHLEL